MHLLGIGTGLLWAPCAGPILGLILTGAALEGASARTVILLVAYAAGAATSLMVALLAGARVFGALKRSLGAEEWIRRLLGVAVLAAVIVVAFGLDRGVLTRVSLASTGGLEQRLVDRVEPGTASRPRQVGAEGPTGAGMMMPELTGATQWIHSPPLTAGSLKGKMVLVDFWTYSCINCLRTLPYIKAWNAKYKDAGLVVIGVHTPEFPFEKDEANVRKAVADLGVTYPVAMDNDYALWRGFSNRYWPADYFIDRTGRVRFHHFGEGGYEESDGWMRSLLEEAGHVALPGAGVQVVSHRAEAPPDSGVVKFARDLHRLPAVSELRFAGRVGAGCRLCLPGPRQA